MEFFIGTVLLPLKLMLKLTRLSEPLTQTSLDGSTTSLPRPMNSTPSQLLPVLPLPLKKKTTMTSTCLALTTKSMKKLKS